jgi:hypothetical protein
MIKSNDRFKLVVATESDLEIGMAVLFGKNVPVRTTARKAA